MRQISRQLFEHWNKAGIRYCHWKSNEHLSEGMCGLTDLDVYVFPDDRVLAESALQELRYLKVVPQKSARYSMVDEWIGFDYDTGKLIHVHLHYQIITGTKYNKEYVFPLDNLVIQSRVQDESTKAYLISPNLEIIILYARIALKASDKRSISPDSMYKREIRFLKERIDESVLREYCGEFFGEMGSVFFDMLLRDSLSSQAWYRLYLMVDEWLSPSRKYPKLIVRIRYRYFRLVALRNAVGNKYLHWHIPVRKTMPNKGLSVCFLGADGSGKSTVSQEIAKWLNWKIEASRFYLGSGEHYNSIVKRLVSKVAGYKAKKKKYPADNGIFESQEKPKEQQTVAKQGLKIRMLRWGYAVLQSVYLMEIAVHSYREIKKANRYIRHGAVALYDRFPQNQFANLYDGPKIKARFFQNRRCGFAFRLMAWIEEQAISRAQRLQPNVIFKLHLPPEESIRRKPDHTLEEVAPKAELTSKLVFEKSRVYDIDATQEYTAEVLAIKRILWNEMIGK